MIQTKTPTSESQVILDFFSVFLEVGFVFAESFFILPFLVVVYHTNSCHELVFTL